MRRLRPELCSINTPSQTHPLVLTTPLTPYSSNPFFKPPAAPSISERLEGFRDVNFRDAAVKKKRVPPPSAPASIILKSSVASSSSPVTPKAPPSNPFRMQPTPDSPAQELKASRQSAQLPAASAESTASTTAAKSPPLPPRPSSLPQQPPPKHVSQLYKKLDDGTQTPTLIKPLHVPAIGPTSLDIISSSLQPEHTGQSNASSGTKQQSTSKVVQNGTGSQKITANGVRLLGSSHIGVDAKPLRAKPPPPRHSSSSEDLMLHKNASDSSLSSLAGMLPRARRDTYSTVTTNSTLNADSRDSRYFTHHEEEHEEGEPLSSFTGPDASINEKGQTTLKGLVVKSKPPLPPPPRRRPESLHIATNPTTRAQKLVFGSTPMTGHPAPFTATSIQSSPAKQRTNSMPYISHSRAVSVAGSSYSQPIYGKPLVKAPAGLTRATSVSHKHRPLDSIISRGRDVSHDWLEKARSGVLGTGGEDRQGLISADEVAFTAKTSKENGSESGDSEPDGGERQSVQERRRELDRIRTEEEPGWARLD